MDFRAVCSTCLQRGRVCDGNPDSCRPCIASAFFCPKDFQRCPVVAQPEWPSQALPAEPSQIPLAQIARDHAELIQSITQFYQVLLDMQYLQEDDVARPPHVPEHVDVPVLQESGYTAEAIFLLQQLPHLKPSFLEIAPWETLPFPYLNLQDLNTISGDNNPRDPLDHPEGEDWVIPPWTFFVSRPAPRTYGDPAYCRIYDTRSKTLGLWSESLINTGTRSRFLMDAHPPSEVLGEWIAALRSLEWVPSLSRRAPKLRTRPDQAALDGMQSALQSMPAEFADMMLGLQKQEINLYWAQRAIYEQCGWPHHLLPDELTRRRAEWDETIQRLSQSPPDLDAYYRTLAGDRAV